MYNFVQKRFYKTELTRGKLRHFPPAIREWRDSVYSFNKEVVKDTALKDELLYETMWSHFSSTRFNKKDRKSSRMRGLIRRSSSKRIFISKPDIKQNSDKSIVTFYLFDRENQLLKKKVYYLKRLLKKNNLMNNTEFFFETLLKEPRSDRIANRLIKGINKLQLRQQIDELKTSREVIIEKNNNPSFQYEGIGNNKELIDKRLISLTKKISFSSKNANEKSYIKNKGKKVDFSKKRKRTRLTLSERRYRRYMLNRKIKKTKVNYDMLSKTVIPSSRKRNLIKTLFLFTFLKWILKKLFNINIKISKTCMNCKKRGMNILLNLNNKKCYKCKKKLSNNKLIIFTITRNNKKLFVVRKRKFNTDILKSINIILSKYLNIFINCFSYNDLLSSKIKISYKLVELFDLYKKLKYKYFISKFLFKELKMLNTFSTLQFNRFKYVDYLSGVKNFVKTLYNKNIELNLVSLKYLHLDSDIYLDSLAVKLRKRKSRLLRVLRKSLKLVRRPKVFSSLLENKDSLTVESELHNNDYKIYSVFDSNNIPNFKTRVNILNNLKYKWITGVRLEAKGRLTKRYTASRALFKYINRGNLKNLDHLYIPSYEIEPISIHRIRNQFKPNLQFTYKYGNKRIGTFGLKGWINSI